tara:strand:+ start:451 stop:636 length:186 start_codon:yes stop_codon:yes gene_type:complete
MPLTKQSNFKAVDENSMALNIKETDFLLKLLLKSSFLGAEIETAYTTIKKLNELHRLKLEN